MVAVNNQQTLKSNIHAAKDVHTTKSKPAQVEPHATIPATAESSVFNKLALISTTPKNFLPNQFLTHQLKSGINPLVDCAAYLFSVLGKLKNRDNYRQFSVLQKELLQELTLFQERIGQLGYNGEYVLVSSYIICATLDDVITHTLWGSHNQWHSFSLLAACKQDKEHHDKFFGILERSIKDPIQYIDLMEFFYICLSLGYKGKFRSTHYGHYQLEQITDQLYKHIRAHRGSFSKILSPTPLLTTKVSPTPVPHIAHSLLFIFLTTACVVMLIFISLGFLMDVISNEAYKNLNQVENHFSEISSA